MSTHFTSGDYIAIKTDTGTSQVRIYPGETAVDACLRLDREIEKSLARIARQRARLTAFLNGQTVSNPDALR